MEELTLQVLFHKEKSIFAGWFRRLRHSHPKERGSFNSRRVIRSMELLRRDLRDRGDTMAQPKKPHACNCMTTDGKDYCGDRCKGSKKMTELVCQCNHPGCKGEPLKA